MDKVLSDLIALYGKDGRVYSVTFTDTGELRVAVMDTDTGKVLARFPQA
jgi:hypothetical protein